MTHIFINLGKDHCSCLYAVAYDDTLQSS